MKFIMYEEYEFVILLLMFRDSGLFGIVGAYKDVSIDFWLITYPINVVTIIVSVLESEGMYGNFSLFIMNVYDKMDDEHMEIMPSQIVNIILFIDDGE